MFNTYSTIGLLTSRLCLGGKSRDTFCSSSRKLEPDVVYINVGQLQLTNGQQSYHSGSVNTSAAESNVWQRHLLLSIVRSSPAFRKLLPDYVEMYNQHKLPEQQVSEQQSTELPKEEIQGDCDKEAKLNLCAGLSLCFTFYVDDQWLVEARNLRTSAFAVSKVENHLLAMIKKCPTYMDYEASDYGVHEFDPQLDFSQFMEEARQHAKEVNFQASSTNIEELGKKKQLGGEKKIKKSWKNSLLSWWKVHKKSKPSMEPAASTFNISKSRKCHVSGPINGSGRGDDIKLRRQTSGPITNLFNPIKRGEDEIPYMCLDQINNSHHVKSYGPVYLVTYLVCLELSD
ncbi:hypothetical protein Q3G72_007381 [Acer saccharum]|nr:hypothetical protein Q3G72_007381 [Acer saccharum]